MHTFNLSFSNFPTFLDVLPRVPRNLRAFRVQQYFVFLYF